MSGAFPSQFNDCHGVGTNDLQVTAVQLLHGLVYLSIR